nr:MAG TPA: hypothetical protein [Caudoviricetes sp.]
MARIAGITRTQVCRSANSNSFCDSSWCTDAHIQEYPRMYFRGYFISDLTDMSGYKLY